MTATTSIYKFERRINGMPSSFRRYDGASWGEFNGRLYFHYAGRTRTGKFTHAVSGFFNDKGELCGTAGIACGMARFYHPYPTTAKVDCDKCLERLGEITEVPA